MLLKYMTEIYILYDNLLKGFSFDNPPWCHFLQAKTYFMTEVMNEWIEMHININTCVIFTSLIPCTSSTFTKITAEDLLCEKISMCNSVMVCSPSHSRGCNSIPRCKWIGRERGRKESDENDCWLDDLCLFTFSSTLHIKVIMFGNFFGCSWRLCIPVKLKTFISFFVDVVWNHASLPCE